MDRQYRSRRFVGLNHRPARLPVGSYLPEVAKSLGIYRSQLHASSPDHEREIEELQGRINRLKEFVATYGQDPDSITRLEEDEKRLLAKREVKAAVDSINRSVDEVIRQISSSEMHFYVNSRDKQMFEFNILRTFVQHPALSTSYVSLPGRNVEMAATPVTQLEYFLEMGDNPSYFKTRGDCGEEYLEINEVGICPNHPVERVSWAQAEEFAKSLNDRGGKYSYRLPTREEWDQAAGGLAVLTRAGQSSPDFEAVAWYKGNSEEKPHPVRKKQALPIGVFDLYGNVWQWVKDAAPDGVDEAGNKFPMRYLRGCSYGNEASQCASSTENYQHRDLAWHDIGFRLVRTPKTK